MILHTLESNGVGYKYAALRTVICDSLNQPLILVAHQGDLGSPIIVLHRGDKGFDEMVKLIPGMTPAKTVDINLALKTKEN